MEGPSTIWKIHQISKVDGPADHLLIGPTDMNTFFICVNKIKFVNIEIGNKIPFWTRLINYYMKNVLLQNIFRCAIILYFQNVAPNKYSCILKVPFFITHLTILGYMSWILLSSCSSISWCYFGKILSHALDILFETWRKCIKENT